MRFSRKVLAGPPGRCARPRRWPNISALWRQFLGLPGRAAKLSCDFFRVDTKRLHVFFVIGRSRPEGGRTSWASPPTPPGPATSAGEGRGPGFRFLIRDRDSSEFTAALGCCQAIGVRIIKHLRSPRANSFAGRYVRTLGVLDHLLIQGERHLRRILTEYSRRYNDDRPRQSREQRPPLGGPGQPIDVTARIKRRQVVHGLISEYRRAG